MIFGVVFQSVSLLVGVSLARMTADSIRANQLVIRALIAAHTIFIDLICAVCSA